MKLQKIPDGLWVFAGGGAGAFMRAVLTEIFPQTFLHLPVAVLCINVLGAFLLGCLLRFLAVSGQDEGWRKATRLGVGTGVMGGFTTYSSFAVGAVSIATSGSVAAAFMYVSASIILGFLACFLGQIIGEKLGFTSKNSQNGIKIRGVR